VIIQRLANLPSSCPADSSSLESCISALKSSISTLESCIKATEGSSGHWETFGWLCAIAVGIGITGELVVIVSEHFEAREAWRRGIIRPPDEPPWWRFWVDIAATIIVLGGVFGEAGASAKIASINSQLRSKTSELRAKSVLLLAVTTEVAGDAATSATTARQEAEAVKGIADEARADAKDALAKAKSAQGELAHAEADAAKAQTAASKALSSADKAESRVAEASNKLDTLWARYERLTTPRSVPLTAKVAAPLMVFSQPEYVFVGACEDQECLELVWNINELLKLAGWKRIKGPPLNIGIPQFTVHGDKDFGVNMSISSGIVISVEHPGGVEAVRAIPDDQAPEYIRAAITLSKVLASNVRPSDNPAGLTVSPGTSKLVRIDVGRKVP
jgi:hypothetical protein